MEYFLIGLLMSVLVAVVLGLIVGYSLLMERLATRRPKSESTPKEETHPAPPAPTIIDRAASHIMSTLLGSIGPIESTCNPVAADAHEGVQGVANGRNPDNDGLTAQPFAQPAIPEAARDIIKFWAQVEDVERIIAGGKVGMVEAIELIFQCRRNGRPDSVYGKARAAITARSEATYRQRQDRLVELAAAAHEEDL